MHLKRARKDRRLTQGELAQQAQLSIDTLGSLEHGKGNLTSFWAALTTLNLDVVGRNLPLGQHIGERIITLRKRKGVSQRDLIKLVGVSGKLSPWHGGHEMHEVRPPSPTASAPSYA
jgi:transcriptional regulator with XRE-family HTH domain